MNKFNLNKEQFKNWYIAYNAYTDVLQVYCDKALSLSKDIVSTKEYENLSIKFDTETGKPIVFEFKNTYSTFKLDPEDVSADRLFDVVSTVLNTYE